MPTASAANSAALGTPTAAAATETTMVAAATPAQRLSKQKTLVPVRLRRMENKVNLAEKLALLDAPSAPGSSARSTTTSSPSSRSTASSSGTSTTTPTTSSSCSPGRLTIQLRDRDVDSLAGELYVVPRGVEHCPQADEEAEVLLIEPEGPVNTGDAGGERTAPERRI